MRPQSCSLEPAWAPRRPSSLTADPRTGPEESSHRMYPGGDGDASTGSSIPMNTPTIRVARVAWRIFYPSNASHPNTRFAVGTLLTWARPRDCTCSDRHGIPSSTPTTTPSCCVCRSGRGRGCSWATPKPRPSEPSYAIWDLSWTSTSSKWAITDRRPAAQEHSRNGPPPRPRSSAPGGTIDFPIPTRRLSSDGNGPGPAYT